MDHAIHDLVEHTARTGADKGYFIVLPEDCCSTMNAAWHDAAVWQRERLAPGARLNGPAILQQADATTVLDRRHHALEPSGAVTEVDDAELALRELAQVGQLAVEGVHQHEAQRGVGDARVDDAPRAAELGGHALGGVDTADRLDLDAVLGGGIWKTVNGGASWNSQASGTLTHPSVSTQISLVSPAARTATLRPRPARLAPRGG